MIKRTYFNVSILFIFGLFCLSCNNQKTSSEPISESVEQPEITNHSDQKAIEIANKVMTAMGGIEAWNDLGFVSWTFFGSRHLVWDKSNGKVRIESSKDSTVYLIDLNNETGKVMKNGMEIQDSVELQMAVKKGKSIWINDSYWLFMPFKLQDKGVNLKYSRQDTTQNGALASVLELTFNGVGDTPENKYEVYVDHSDNLIKQWAYYQSASQESPSRVWPWDNYKVYGGLLLSGERTDNSGPSNIRVYADIEDGVFSSFDKFEYY